MFYDVYIKISQNLIFLNAGIKRSDLHCKEGGRYMTFVVCIKVGLIVFELLAIALMVAMLWDDFKKH